MGQMGQMDHGKIMEILDRAPPFHPRILGIARDLTGPDGTIDQEAATLRTEEIETAQQEARNYTEAVGRLRAAISCRI